MPIRRQFRILAMLSLPVALFPVVWASGSRAETFEGTELEALWAATDVGERLEEAGRLAAIPLDFDSLYGLLSQGPSYDADQATGRLEWTWADDGGRVHHSLLFIPRTYDPSLRYPVHVYLHGNINYEPWPAGGGWWRRTEPLTSEGHISVFPAGWHESRWWQESQVRHLAALLDRLRSSYNVDENRCYLAGVSDGGTGVFFHAFRAPTVWAAFFPFIGHPSVLNSPSELVDGEMYVNNLSNRPLFVVSGERDPKYPAASMVPYVDLFGKAGVELEFRRVPGGHDTRFWPSEAARIREFRRAHPRDALPDRLSWKTERVDIYNRVSWLIIEELDEGADSWPFLRYSTVDTEDGEGIAKMQAFLRELPAGQVEAQREGNRLELRSSGVRRYRLLLSPEEFDFAQPVVVVNNGSIVFEGKIQPSSEVLLRWFARDHDRTALFGAELPMVVGDPAGAP